jgi:hypothetical protein
LQATDHADERGGTLPAISSCALGASTLGTPPSHSANSAKIRGLLLRLPLRAHHLLDGT